MQNASLLSHQAMLRRIVLCAGLVLPVSAFAMPGYVTDSAGQVVHDSAGQCVRTGNWTVADANAECDADLMPAAMPTPAPAPAQPAPAAPPPAPKLITLNEQASGKAHLGFNKYQITEGERQILDNQLKSVDPKAVQEVIVTGYTDRLGPKAYNMKLSQKRARSVADYLMARYHFPASKMSVVGKGPADPIVSCKGFKGKALVKCLAPNRRVTVEITWMRQVLDHNTSTTAPQG